MVAGVLLPHLGGTRSHPPTGDHEGPPNPTCATLAPTDHPASCLTSQLSLMPIRADQSAVGAVNRPLRVSAFTGRFFVMPLRKPLRTRRGGGWDDAGRGPLRRPRPLPTSAFPLQPGRRKRPHSTSQPLPPLRVRCLPPKTYL